MNTAVWVFQVLLALMFLAAGIRHLIITEQKIKERPDDIIADFTILQVRWIGLLELLGAIGVILPWWIKIVPILTPISAIGFSITMIVALGLFLKHRVFRRAPLQIVILIMSIIVAIVRMRPL